jgi:predicted phosphodiesterase
MKRILVFSDMHGNALAFDAMLEDVRGENFDGMVCLGDAIQSGPQPAETVSRLRELGCPVVMGNADDWLLSGEDSGAEQIASERLVKMEAVRAWSLEQLSNGDLEFIRGFQPTVRLPLEDGLELICSHGSPTSFDDVILPTITDEELRAMLEPQPSLVYCGGHTHVQFVRHLRETFHFNPGSVGYAYRHEQSFDVPLIRSDPFAEYAVLTSGEGKLRLEFRRVTLDVERLIAVYRSSGRPFAEEAASQYQSI